MEFFLDEINEILGFINWNDSERINLQFNSVSIDSRTISQDELFIAIKGDNYDGINFVDEAISKGIKAVVIKNGSENILPSKLPFWSVPDTLLAFQKLALLKRKKLKLPVIAITGSVGKTTTKEITSKVLETFGKVHKSEANFNNEVGVGLTLINTDASHKVIVLEMGMRGFGQIENLSKFSEPDIAIITNIGSSHIGLLGSRENIAIAKCEIVKHLNPDGLVIIPYGDKLLDKVIKKVWKGRIIRTKLLSSFNDCQQIESNHDLVVGFYDPYGDLIKVENKTFSISFNGIHNARNFLFSYAVSKEFGINFKEFNELNFVPMNGRNNILKTKKLTIFDETYNASPESIKACIKILIQQNGNQFFVFGSMKELGNMSNEFHIEILNYIYSSTIEKCIFLHDPEQKIMQEKYKYLEKKIFFVTDRELICPILNKLTNKGDFLLIKGSRDWELEKIIPSID